MHWYNPYGLAGITDPNGKCELGLILGLGERRFAQSAIILNRRLYRGKSFWLLAEVWTGGRDSPIGTSYK